MVSFENALDTAKSRIARWNDFAGLDEVNLVRDAKGRISVYVVPQNHYTVAENSVDVLKNDLTTNIGGFFSDTIFVEGAEDWTKDLFDKIHELRVEDQDPPSGANTSVKWYVVERGIAKKAWIQCCQKEQAAWPYGDTQPDASEVLPKIVTFFSYKGGMGRTTALTAVALELLRRKKNVLMLDTDLEAPGLSTFFFPADDAGYIRKGTVDYLQEKSMNPNTPMNMSDYIIPLTSPVYMENGMGNLYLVSGGKLNDEFLLKLARIDSQELVGENLKKNLVQLLKDCCEALKGSGGIDYILIDSRAGFHDMAGVVTAQIPHGIVLFGKDSFQSWFGIQQAVRTIATSQADKPFAIMVDSACGVNGIVSEEEKEHFRQKSYEVFCSDYYDNDMQPGIRASREAHDPVFVRYMPALSGDIQLYDENRTEDLKTQLSDQPYREIAERIMERFGEAQEGDAENSGQDSFA